MNSEQFRRRLADAVQQIGAHSAACIRMDNSELRRQVLKNNVAVSNWLLAGWSGEMDYLDQRFEEKADPWTTFPFAKSVIVLAFTNQWGDPTVAHSFPGPNPGAPVGYISAYARGMDYHLRGQSMLAELQSMLGPGVQAEATVDTKPVYERIFASVGGLGVRGGNGLLRVPDPTGVRVYIGCLFVDVELPEVIQEPQLPFLCSDCRVCVEKCPTKALRFEQPMDARRCISYLSIEKKGVLSSQESKMIGDWLFGCDGCTSACPPFRRDDLRIPVDLEWLLKSSAGTVRRAINGSAVAYTGVTRLRRNAVAILSHSTSPRARELLMWVEKETGSKLIRDQLTACQGDVLDI